MSFYIIDRLPIPRVYLYTLGIGNISWYLATCCNYLLITIDEDESDYHYDMSEPQEMHFSLTEVPESTNIDQLLKLREGKYRFIYTGTLL